MSNKQELMDIVRVLITIKWQLESGNTNRHGICYWFTRLYNKNHIFAYMKKYNVSFSDWEYYSGQELYPVPDPEGVLTGYEAYHNLPKYTGAYGIKRIELLHWLIEQFESKLPSKENEHV